MKTLVFLALVLVLTSFAAADSALCPVGQELVQQDITATAVFATARSTGDGNTKPIVNVNDGKEKYASGSPFLLVSAGQPKIDTKFTANRVGMVIKRMANNQLMIHFDGHETEGKEMIDATLTLSGATFGTFTNAKTEENRINHPRDGKANIGNADQDEVFFLNPNTIRIVSTTQAKNDRFFITYIPACQPTAPPMCSDSKDNDNDGKFDFPNDPGCVDANDNDESDPAVLPACSDNLDNDGDLLIDFLSDPGCASASDNDETNPLVVPACSDGLDNDGDMKFDYPNDPGCTSPADTDEFNAALTACSDMIDNDGDNAIDYPQDFGCTSAADTDETNRGTTQCSDGVDNDNDGVIDQQDPDCDSRFDTIEYPIACLSDSDCPQGLVGGLSCQKDNVMQTYVKTICVNPGSVQAVCQTTFQESVIVEHCDELCSVGACVSRQRDQDIFNDDLYISSIRIDQARNFARVAINFENTGDQDMDDVRVSLVVRELDLYQSLGRVDVDNGDSATMRGMLELPASIAPGEYTVGVILSNDDMHRKVYRRIRIQ